MGKRTGRGGKKARAWCFTLHNFFPSDVLHLRSIAGRAGSPAIYCVFGREFGSKTGRRHLQGFIYFRNAREMRGVKNIIGNKEAHVEAARGSVDANHAYCTKDGDWEEYGDRPSQGRRSDLDRIKRSIESGETELSIAKEHFSQWVVYRRSFEAYRSLLQSAPQIRPDLRVYVLWGDAGVGKTRYVYEHHDDVWASSTPDLKWFDGYKGQKVALLDDFRGQADFGWLLRVLDIYPLQVPVKGGFVSWCPDTIYMTSNLYPPDWYVNEGDITPLTKRITKMIHVKPDEWDNVKTFITSEINN